MPDNPRVPAPAIPGVDLAALAAEHEKQAEYARITADSHRRATEPPLRDTAIMLAARYDKEADEHVAQARALRLAANVLAGAERRRTLVAEVNSMALVCEEAALVVSRAYRAACIGHNGPDSAVRWLYEADGIPPREWLEAIADELAALDDLLPAPTGGHGP